MAVIYQITNMANGKYYIGSAASFARREWQHKYDLKRNAHKNPRLQAAWNKYGADAFVFEVIEELPSEAHPLQIEDTYLIQHVGKADCYNINMSAESPRTGILHTQASKDKTSASRTGKGAGEEHYRYGQEVSAEVREKIGAAQRGVAKGPRTFSPDGLLRAQENMRRNAQLQEVSAFDTVLAKFPAMVQIQYDFKNAVYTGALERITGVVCDQHGVFSQYAARFRKGAGCPACGAAQRAESKKQQMLAEWATAEGREKMMTARKKTVAHPTDN
jgi:group I intron endonuclease